jgi:hypothetical protein
MNEWVMELCTRRNKNWSIVSENWMTPPSEHDDNAETMKPRSLEACFQSYHWYIADDKKDYGLEFRIRNVKTNQVIPCDLL